MEEGGGNHFFYLFFMRPLYNYNKNFYLFKSPRASGIYFKIFQGNMGCHKITTDREFEEKEEENGGKKGNKR